MTTLPLALQFAYDLCDTYNGKKVLDAGCGDKKLMNACQAVGAAAIGYDLLYGDDIRKPFRDGDFDIVFMIGVANFVHDDLEQVIKNVQTSMKTGGIFVMNYKPKSWIIRDFIHKYILRETIVSGYRTKEELEDMLIRNGFTNIKHTGIKNKIFFSPYVVATKT